MKHQRRMVKYHLLLRSCYTGVSNLSLQLTSYDISMMKAETIVDSCMFHNFTTFLKFLCCVFLVHTSPSAQWLCVLVYFWFGYSQEANV